ncbi:MAG: GNAT family N-acetyltransferase [Marmoricola sp.]
MTPAPSPEPIDIRVVDPSDPDAQASLRAYYVELAELFDSGFDPAQSLLPDPAEMRPPNGLFLLARLAGEPVGCVGLKRAEGKPAEIKRMWVSREARGRGLARRLLEEVEGRALELGYDRLRLDTNRTLTAAIALYKSAGYVEIDRFNDERYAHHWFEKWLMPGSGAGLPDRS